jgi:hypothetical protein
MVIILKGSPFQGTVSMSAHGPFHTEREAVDYALKEWEGEPEWFIMEVHHPADYNAEDNAEFIDADAQEITPQEFERMMAEVAARKDMQKEVLFDLSEIPIGA